MNTRKFIIKYAVLSNIRITKEGNNHILEITNVKKEQAGECACIAKNSAGTKRQNSQLTVKEVGVPPTFARNLEVA